MAPDQGSPWKERHACVSSERTLRQWKRLGPVCATAEGYQARFHSSGGRGGSTLWLRLNPGSRWSEANTPNDITAADESEIKLSLILQQLLR